MRIIALSMLTAILLIPTTALIAQTPENPTQPEPSPVEETSLSPGAELQDTEQGSDAEAADATYNDEATMEDDEELPRTASPLALLALVGAAGAGSALSLRSLRRRS